MIKHRLNRTREPESNESPNKEFSITSIRKAISGRLAGLTIGLATISTTPSCYNNYRERDYCEDWNRAKIEYRDSESALSAVETHGWKEIWRIDPRLFQDETFVLELLKRTSPADVLQDCNAATQIYRRIPDFMLKAMRINEEAFEYADDSLISNREWLLQAMDINIEVVARALLTVPYESSDTNKREDDARYINDKEVILRILRSNIKWLESIEHENLRHYNPDTIHELIGISPAYVIPILERTGVNLEPQMQYLVGLINGNIDLYYVLSDDMRLHPDILMIRYRELSKDDALKLSKNLRTLNITKLERFDLKTLQILVDNRLRNQPHPEKGAEKRLATLTFPKADYNRAFRTNEIDTLIGHGYHVMYYEANTEDDVYEALKDSTRAAKNGKNSKIDLWILAGHGSRKEVALGAPDPYRDREDFYIDTTDFELKNYAKYLKPGAQIVLQACFNGEGAGDLYNFATFIHSNFPETTVHAATTGHHLVRYGFDPDSKEVKRYVHSYYAETNFMIYPESDKSYLAEKARKGGHKWITERWKDKQFVLEELRYGSIDASKIDESFFGDTQFMIQAAKFLNISDANDYFEKFDPNKKHRKDIGFMVAAMQVHTIRAMFGGFFSECDRDGELSRNETFMLAAIAVDSSACKKADQSLRSNPDFMLKAIEANGDADLLGCANRSLKQNRDFILKAFRLIRRGTIRFSAYGKLHDSSVEVLSDAELMLVLIGKNPSFVLNIDLKLFNDPTFLLALMKTEAANYIKIRFNSPYSTGYVISSLADGEIEFVTRLPEVFEIKLFEDPDFMLSVIRINPEHKRLIPGKLLKDPAFMEKVNQISAR